MKIIGKKYTDISKVDIYPIDSLEAKSMIIKYHYSHKWPGGIYSFGVYYEKKLIGCVSYGHITGKDTIKSITNNIKIDNNKLFELKRLWISDGFGTNIESYSIGQTFKILRNYGIDILISYSDPEQDHLGKIYQATNWIYQGQLNDSVHCCGYLIQGKRYHVKTVLMKYGVKEKEVEKNILKIDPNFKKFYAKSKHRYLYILNKKLKKKILNDLKHPIKKYPKGD